jgi:hypothetical protein
MQLIITLDVIYHDSNLLNLRCNVHVYGCPIDYAPMPIYAGTSSHTRNDGLTVPGFTSHLRLLNSNTPWCFTSTLISQLGTQCEFSTCRYCWDMLVQYGSLAVSDVLSMFVVYMPFRTVVNSIYSNLKKQFTGLSAAYRAVHYPSGDWDWWRV